MYTSLYHSSKDIIHIVAQFMLGISTIYNQSIILSIGGGQHTTFTMDSSTGKAWETEPIAIVGLSCKFAGGANNAEKLWDMLAEGQNAWSEIPSSRFSAKAVYHPNSERLSTVSFYRIHKDAV